MWHSVCEQHTTVVYFFKIHLDQYYSRKHCCKKSAGERMVARRPATLMRDGRGEAVAVTSYCRA